MILLILDSWFLLLILILWDISWTFSPLLSHFLFISLSSILLILIILGVGGPGVCCLPGLTVDLSCPQRQLFHDTLLHINFVLLLLTRAMFFSAYVALPSTIFIVLNTAFCWTWCCLLHFAKLSSSWQSSASWTEASLIITVRHVYLQPFRLNTIV